MAAEIHRAYPDVQVEMIASGGGRFEVRCDGAPVFEKSRLKRHAQPGEVVRLLGERRERK